ncbi:MAG: putative methyltransferase [Ilumatobacteraceae bacterium]|nr:putative methyltransferase [Ilumatobacteraceae bacterium]
MDVGCGPGQWTSFLAGRGADVEGIDPVAVFVEEAQRRHPDVAFRVGRAQALEVEDASLGGVLAWYSLILADPTEIGDALNEFARCLRRGGGLAIGFFEGPELEPFDHAVTTAYFWPLEQLSGLVERAGFSVTEAGARTDPGVRRQGRIFAQRQQ